MYKPGSSTESGMGPRPASFESQSSSVHDSPGRSESIGLALRSERSAFPFEAGVDVLSS
jgi:hypothetical protein